eukprot:1158712-Pelagomonas_calceolata.AAC.3
MTPQGPKQQLLTTFWALTGPQNLMFILYACMVPLLQPPPEINPTGVILILGAVNSLEFLTTNQGKANFLKSLIFQKGRGKTRSGKPAATVSTPLDIMT